MRFNGTTTKLIICLIGLFLLWCLFVFGGIVVSFFVCLGCELPLPTSNSGWCQESNFFYRFTGAVGSVPGEFQRIFGGFNITAMADLTDPLLLPQIIERHKPAILILCLTACVACVTRFLTGTPIFMIAPTQPPLATPRACVMTSTLRGG